MQESELQKYLLPLLVLGFFAWRFLKYRKVKGQIPALLQEGAIVVDVRSPEEFKAAARPGSLNIPLTALATRAKELDKNKPIILCCASGARSGMALGILKSQGFAKVVNAGAWTNTLT